MDPVTAISLVASIFQFVDFGTKIFKSAKEIQQSSSGMTRENQTTLNVIDEMQRLSKKLQVPGTEPQSEDERALRKMASECRKLSEEILELLKKTTPKDSKSLYQAVGSVYKTWKYAGEKAALEQRLDYCRSQLGVQLNYVSSEDIKEQLRVLTKDAKLQTNTLKTLQLHIDELRQGVATASISCEAQKQLQSLLEIPGAVLDTITNQAIRQGLAYSNMRDRFDVVDKEHYRTFRWVLEEDPDGNAQHHAEARKLLTGWLSNGNGIFHIAGKLGSGKSTLVKFLFNHQRTKDELRKWAGKRKLALVNFFFWRPGCSKQKSFRGLQRSLLHDILLAYPELTLIVFPKFWKDVRSQLSIHFQRPEDVRFQNDDIETAFQQLLSHIKTQATYCFCFFLDALDEYEDEGSHEIHVKDMVDSLKKWIVASNGAIKICLSSREDNIFSNAFANDAKLCLQDLTNKDMRLYVQDKLKDIEEGSIRDRLGQQIVDRSDGIFLWVVLVVKSLREYIEDGLDLMVFEKELSALPSELEALFEHLLNSIRPPTRAKAYKIFAMVSTLAAYNCRLPIISCLFLDDYENDPLFAIKRCERETQARLPDKYAKGSQIQQDMILKAKKLIQGCCKGLVEVQVYQDDLTKTEYALFAHRTVPDFLERKAQDEMRACRANFPLNDAIPNLLLAYIPAAEYLKTSDTHWATLICSTLKIQYTSRIDGRRTRFLKCLEQVVHRKISKENTLFLNLPEYYDVLFNGMKIRSNQLLLSLCLTRKDDGSSYTCSIPVFSPLYISAYLGNGYFVKERLLQDPSLLNNDICRSLLSACLSVGLSGQQCIRRRHFGTILDCIDRTLEGGLAPMLQRLWTRLILNYIQSDRSGDSPQHDAMGKLIALFLRKIRNPKFLTVSVRYSKGSPANSAETSMEVLLDAKQSTICNEGSIVFNGRRNAATDFVIAHEGGIVTFRELIEYWNFKNNDEIFKLMQELEEEQEERRFLSSEIPGSTATTALPDAASPPFAIQASEAAQNDSNSSPELDQDESPILSRVAAQDLELGYLERLVQGWKFLLFIFVGAFLAFIAARM